MTNTSNALTNEAELPFSRGKAFLIVAKKLCDRSRGRQLLATGYGLLVNGAIRKIKIYRICKVLVTGFCLLSAQLNVKRL